MIRPSPLRFLTFVGIGLLIRLQAAPAQEAERARAATEANGQATEADRLLKLGDFAAARPLFEAEAASRRAAGDLRYEAYALRAVGVCHGELGDDRAAITAWRAARVLDLKRDDPGFAGYDDLLIGRAEARLGQPDAAIATLQGALPRLDGAADRDHLADALLVLARVLVEQGRPADARSHAERAQTLADGLHDDARRADAAVALGLVAAASHQPAEALAHFDRALGLFDAQGREADAAAMEGEAASCLAQLNRPAEALARGRQTADRHRRLDDPSAVAHDLTFVAGLLLAAQRVDEARDAAAEAVAVARDADDLPGEVAARVHLAQAQGAKGDWSAAAATLDEAATLSRQAFRNDPAEQIRIVLTAAATDRRAGLIARSDDRLRLAARLAANAGSDPLRQTVAAATTQIQAPTSPSSRP